MLAGVGFRRKLRTSELVQLKRKEVALPQANSLQEAVLLLDSSKGTKRNLLPINKIVLDEKLALQALRFLCQGLKPGETLSQVTNLQFRTLFKDLLAALHLALANCLHLRRCRAPIHGANHPPAQGPCFVRANGHPF